MPILEYAQRYPIPKDVAIAEAYNPYLVDNDDEDDEEEEIVAAKWNWGKKIVMVPNP